MGSLLHDTELDQEQQEILNYMISSAEKAIDLLSRKSPEMEDRTMLQKGQAGNAGDDSFKVLVAEDDEINRLYLTTILKRQNWFIDEAKDGFQAVELCKKNRYGIILMDVSMPGLDGIQAARKIREEGTLSPIIAITAHSILDFQGDFVNAGVDEILRKPFDENTLIRTILKLTDPGK